MKEEDKISAENSVKKRVVFYFSGFDPRGPSHYQKLYASESALQAPLNGLDLKVGKRRKISPVTHGWDIDLEETGTKTEYEFLRWRSNGAAGARWEGAEDSRWVLR